MLFDNHYSSIQLYSLLLHYNVLHCIVLYMCKEKGFITLILLLQVRYQLLFAGFSGIVGLSEMLR